MHFGRCSVAEAWANGHGAGSKSCSRWWSACPGRGRTRLPCSRRVWHGVSLHWRVRAWSTTSRSRAPELRDDPVALRRLSRLNFQNHAKAYADLMQLPSARIEAMRPLLKVTGLENLDAARSLGRGVLAVSCHMGSYEVVSAIWAATLAPVSFFAEELEPRALFEWYRDTRARLGISVLTLDMGGIRKVLQALREQEMVITAIDRDITETGYLMPFFGKLAPIPLGPASIALRLGTPLLPVCVYRLPDDTYMAEAAPHVFAKPTGNPRADQVP